MCGKKQSMPPVIMTSLKDDGQAHQISVTRPVFEYLGKLLRTTISFPLSTRHNAMYGFDDMYRVLIRPHDVHEQGIWQLRGRSAV